MTLLENILLYIPLALGICLISQALRRDSMREIVRSALRVFSWLTVTMFVSCAVIFWIMETVLD